MKDRLGLGRILAKSPKKKGKKRDIKSAFLLQKYFDAFL